MSVMNPEETMQDQTLEWIDEILETDQSIQLSKNSLSNEEYYKYRRYWEFLAQNITHSYKSLVNLVSKKNKKRPLKRMSENNEFLVYDVNAIEKDDNVKSNYINEWYKREYASQVGEPQQDDLDERLAKAANGLKWQSKCIAFDRLFYSPPIQHELTLEQVSWHDAPFALTCTCPAMVCMCSCRKSYLLPPGHIPRRWCPFWFGVKRFLWFFHIMKYPTPAGTLVPKLVDMVDTESAYYKSSKGKKILAQKGPEFCMSGCLQFLLSSSQANAELAAELAKMQQIDLEGLQEAGSEFDDPDVVDTKSYCDGFMCTVATQTENDEETGELLMGEYTHVLYASGQNTFMSDADGKKLGISFYTEEPPDPWAFSFSRVLHVDDMKQQYQKVKKLYSSISVMIDKYSTKHLSKADHGGDCCHDSASCYKRSEQNRIRKAKLRAEAEKLKALEDKQTSATWQKLEKAKSSIRKYLRYISLSDPCDMDYSKPERKKCLPKPDESSQDISNKDIDLVNVERAVEIAGDTSADETSDYDSGKEKAREIDAHKSSDKLKFKVSFKDQKPKSASSCDTCKR